MAAALGILASWTGAARAAELAPSDEAAKPSFSLESLADGRIDLSEQKGRVVLVHFFATWCEPCRPELSALQRLADRFAQRPLMIFAVDVGEVDARVRRFFDELPVTFPVLFDRDKAVTKAWKVALLPTTFVLDRIFAPASWSRATLIGIGRTPIGSWTRSRAQRLTSESDIEVFTSLTARKQ